MKKKISIGIYPFVLLGFAVLLTSNCSKEDNSTNPTEQLPVLTTSPVSAITQTTATCGGNVGNEGGSPVTFRGVCWSTNQTPTIADAKTLNGTGIGPYTSSITGLSEGSTYYVRAYATNSSGTSYGNAVPFPALLIGQSYQGGILAYILQPGDAGYTAAVPHGLVCEPTERTSGSYWDLTGVYTSTGATATALGTGMANTNAIVSSLGTSAAAAKLCFDLVLGGHSDWFLPSRDELNKLYVNRVAISGFSTDYYWSSSEAGISTAWIQSFDNGAQSSYAKLGKYHVRAVRSF